MLYPNIKSKNRWQNTGYKLCRELSLIRDGYRCQKCGRFGRSLHVHHIKNFAQYPQERISIRNSVVLCGPCHYRFHSLYGNRNNNLGQLLRFLRNL